MRSVGFRHGFAQRLFYRVKQVVAPYMDVSRKARFGDVKFQRACSLTYGLLLQAFHPAGPDGIRGQGSHLKFEFKTLGDYRIVPAPV